MGDGNSLFDIYIVAVKPGEFMDYIKSVEEDRALVEI